MRKIDRGILQSIRGIVKSIKFMVRNVAVCREI